MLDHRERTDAPGDPGTRLPERVLPGRDDLKQRLERLADLHPSSPDYPTVEPGRSDRQRADSRGLVAPRDEARNSGGEQHSRDGRHGGDGPGRPSDRPDLRENRNEPARRAGWDAPDVRDHPERPDVTDIRLPDDRGRHILDGDGRGSLGGGHRHGTGRSGKTEFPSTWPDEVVLPIVEEITRTPDSVERQRNGRWLATGERDGVTVKTIVLSDGRIWTAWPEPGGSGVRQNPKEGDA